MLEREGGRTWSDVSSGGLSSGGYLEIGRMRRRGCWPGDIVVKEGFGGDKMMVERKIELLDPMFRMLGRGVFDLAFKVVRVRGADCLQGVGWRRMPLCGSLGWSRYR